MMYFVNVILWILLHFISVDEVRSRHRQDHFCGKRNFSELDMCELGHFTGRKLQINFRKATDISPNNGCHCSVTALESIRITIKTTTAPLYPGCGSEIVLYTPDVYHVIECEETEKEIFLLGQENIDVEFSKLHPPFDAEYCLEISVAQNAYRGMSVKCEKATDWSTGSTMPPNNGSGGHLPPPPSPPSPPRKRTDPPHFSRKPPPTRPKIITKIPKSGRRNTVTSFLTTTAPLDGIQSNGNMLQVNEGLIISVVVPSAALIVIVLVVVFIRRRYVNSRKSSRKEKERTNASRRGREESHQLPNNNGHSRGHLQISNNAYDHLQRDSHRPSREYDHLHETVPISNNTYDHLQSPIREEEVYTEIKEVYTSYAVPVQKNNENDYIEHV